MRSIWERLVPTPSNLQLQFDSHNYAETYLWRLGKSSDKTANRPALVQLFSYADLFSRTPSEKIGLGPVDGLVAKHHH